MYKKHTAYGTTTHTFEFDPETYWWTIEIGKSGQLETLQQIAPDADYSINWSVFDWNTGKDGYGRIQNGDKIIQPSNYDFPTVSFVDGKLRRGEFACDCDGGGSTACRSKDGYIYNQGRAIAGAMVLRKKTLLEMCLPKVGCGYVWGAQGEILTRDVLNRLIRLHGRQKYYFSGYSAEKWFGKQVFDCSGLIVWAANKLGIFQADYTAAGLYNLCQPIQSPSVGDLCFNKNLTHVGIYAGNGRYLHAKGTKDGVVITDKYTFVKFGRLKGGASVATDWNAKNKEFVKYVQRMIGLTGSDIDGLAGAKTAEYFERFLNSKGNTGDEIKKAWSNFLNAIK